VSPGPDGRVLLAYALGAVAAYLVARFLWRPFAWAAALAWRLGVGGAAVWLSDAVARALGVQLHVGVNPVTAAVAGFLGLPGLAALLTLAAVR
jgi:inhibitor of the pro-sigma K processing machinery